MLYTPPAFKMDDLPALHDHIDSAGLGTIVSVGERGPLISYAPLLLDRNAGPFGTLIGHLAKANQQTLLSRLDLEAVAVFPGPDAYISPGWYASKREHGRVVPTWNYTVVHARGRFSVFHDPVRLLDVVDRLTNRHEGQFAKPWSTADAPKEFIEAQLWGIVGIQIVIDSLEGKRKLSQNRPKADQAGVIEGLGESRQLSDHSVAELMRGGSPA